MEVGGGKLESFYGDYEYYLEKTAGTAGAQAQDGLGRLAPAQSEEKKPAASEESDEPRLSRQQQREQDKQRQKEERAREKKLSEIERQIGVKEGELARLEEEMAAPEFFSNHEAARVAGDRHTALSAEITALYEAWEAL